jgi:hypothetical protein
MALPRRPTGTRGRVAGVGTVPDSSTSGWASTASAVAAWLALLLSIINLGSTLRRENRREQRQKPLLVPYLQDGLVQILADKSSRLYAFLLSISNRSDSNNSIREIELRLTYTTAVGVQLTVKLLSDPDSGKAFAEAAPRALSMPARVDAHQTISGWSFFRLQQAILERVKQIEKHVLTIIDSHGNEVSVEPIYVQDYGNENQATPQDHI